MTADPWPERRRSRRSTAPTPGANVSLSSRRRNAKTPASPTTDQGIQSYERNRRSMGFRVGDGPSSCHAGRKSNRCNGCEQRRRSIPPPPVGPCAENCAAPSRGPPRPVQRGPITFLTRPRSSATVPGSLSAIRRGQERAADRRRRRSHGRPCERRPPTRRKLASSGPSTRRTNSRVQVRFGWQVASA